MSLNETLQDRGNEYGQFISNSAISQDLKDYIRQTPNWESLESDQREALDMIMHKVSRITVGNHNNIDSWHDIAGYAELVAKRLSGEFM